MSKRFQKEKPSTPHISTRRPSVPAETAAKLFHIGARARKHVSEGHITPGASSYSYQQHLEPQAPPPIYDRGEFKDLRQPSDLQIRAESHRQPAKRKYNQKDTAYDDDEDATDVDEEDGLPDKPQSINSIKAFYVPQNYKPAEDQQMDDEFDEVSFLQPKDSL